MPPFRHGSIEVDSLLLGEALHELRDIGHGHRINIVDASYDIPRGKRVVGYPGASARALDSIARLIPIEGYRVEIMAVDRQIAKDARSDHISARAGSLFSTVVERSLESAGIALELEWLYRDAEYGDFEADRFFYDVANSADNSTFFRTIDNLPFACATFVAGHSQLTE